MGNQFKRGDKVLTLSLQDYGIRIFEATVTATKGETVYTKHVGENGYEWKDSFAPDGRSHREPKPLWCVRKLKPEDNIEKLRELCTKTTDAYNEYKKKVQEVYRQVESEAYEWKTKESSRRQAEITGGWKDMEALAASMGFEKSKAKEKAAVAA